MSIKDARQIVLADAFGEKSKRDPLPRETPLFETLTERLSVEGLLPYTPTDIQINKLQQKITSIEVLFDPDEDPCVDYDGIKQMREELTDLLVSAIGIPTNLLQKEDQEECLPKMYIDPHFDHYGRLLNIRVVSYDRESDHIKSILMAEKETANNASLLTYQK